MLTASITSQSPKEDMAGNNWCGLWVILVRALWERKGLTLKEQQSGFQQAAVQRRFPDRYSGRLTLRPEFQLPLE